MTNRDAMTAAVNVAQIPIGNVMTMSVNQLGIRIMFHKIPSTMRDAFTGGILPRFRDTRVRRA